MTDGIRALTVCLPSELRLFFFDKNLLIMSHRPKTPPLSYNPQEVWLAGLSALSQAHSQGQKAVQDLVAQGEALQNKAQAQWSEMAQRVSNPFGSATPPTSRLESIFEQRVAQALQALGVPTAQEVKALRQEVADLKAQIAAAQPSAVRTSRPAKKAAARTTSPKVAGSAAKRSSTRS